MGGREKCEEEGSLFLKGCCREFGSGNDKKEKIWTSRSLKRRIRERLGEEVCLG